MKMWGTNLSRSRMTHPAINNQFDNVWFVNDDAGHVDRLAPTDFAPTPVEKVKYNRNGHIKPSVSLHGYEHGRRPILVVIPRPMVPPIRLLLQHSAKIAGSISMRTLDTCRTAMFGCVDVTALTLWDGKPGGLKRARKESDDCSKMYWNGGCGTNLQTSLVSLSVSTSLTHP